MDPHRLQAFMKGGAGEFSTSLPAQMKESALELLETTWQTPSVLPMATHKRQHCFCGWTVCIMRSQCANFAIGSWLASFLAAQMDQQKRSFGKIVPSGPQRVTCVFHCGVISVFLIDLYHLRWCDRTQTHSSQIPSEDSSAKQFSRSCVWSIFFPPRPQLRSHFYQQLLYFWQGGKPGQGVPLNGSNLEKWIEPGSLMAPRGSGELWGKWFIQRYLAEVILAFTLM